MTCKDFRGIQNTIQKENQHILYPLKTDKCKSLRQSMVIQLKGYKHIYTNI